MAAPSPAFHESPSPATDYLDRGEKWHFVAGPSGVRAADYAPFRELLPANAGPRGRKPRLGAGWCSSLLVLIGSAIGCQQTTVPSTRQVSSQQQATPSTTAATEQHYGSPVSSSTPVGIGEVLAHPADYQDRPVLVEGHVRRACEKRGCWMEMAASADPQDPGCRVTFKDYGFFVPTTSAGSKARVEGIVQSKTLNSAEVRHLESDGAKFANKDADGRVQEVRLVATGVTLTR